MSVVLDRTTVMTMRHALITLAVSLVVDATLGTLVPTVDHAVHVMSTRPTVFAMLGGAGQVPPVARTSMNAAPMRTHVMLMHHVSTMTDRSVVANVTPGTLAMEVQAA